jgi:hypothetical protein
MSFLSAIGKDIKAVFGWLGSSKGEKVIETAGGIAVAFGAPAMLVNLAENWIHKVIATEALAVAAGQQDGSGTQKAAAVLNAMEPVVAAYFPSATQDQMKKANDAIVAFLNAFEAPPAAPVVPTKAGA